MFSVAEKKTHVFCCKEEDKACFLLRRRRRMFSVAKRKTKHVFCCGEEGNACVRCTMALPRAAACFGTPFMSWHSRCARRLVFAHLHLVLQGLDAALQQRALSLELLDAQIPLVVLAAFARASRQSIRQRSASLPTACAIIHQTSASRRLLLHFGLQARLHLGVHALLVCWGVCTLSFAHTHTQTQYLRKWPHTDQRKEHLRAVSMQIYSCSFVSVYVSSIIYPHKHLHEDKL
jgi:hypothetical protein